MTVFSKRVWIAILLSSTLCGLLIYFSPVPLSETASQIRPEWGAAGFCLFLLNLMFRGLRLSDLSDASHSVKLNTWIHCAARNQFMFSALPSASGDLGFPYIANKLCGISFGAATRLIALYRFQDMLALAGLLALGLALSIGNIFLTVVALLAIPIMLYWSESIVLTAVRILFKIVVRMPFIGQLGVVARIEQTVNSTSQTGPHQDHFRSSLSVAWTMLSWGLAVSAFWCLFRMVGEELSLGTILVIVAGLNFFGTINTLTIGGLGVSESALATLLLYLNYSYESAVSIALVVRPSALVMTLTACLVIELVAYLCRCRVNPIYSSAKP